MGKFCRLLAFLMALWPLGAMAQGPTGGNPAFQYYYGTSAFPGGQNNPANWVATSAATPTPVTVIGGGGGGLSVVDGAAFTAGTSPFTPSGCQYNSTPPAIASGTQGTPACDAFRAYMVDVPLPGANANNLYNILTAPTPVSVNGSAAPLTGLTQGTTQTGTITAANAIDTTANAAQTNISASTSGTPSTATTLIASNAARHKIIIKVEGATAVCFSQFGTASIGSAGTWCLKGASSANAGDGGSYVTPVGQTDQNAFSMISTGTSILVTAWWQ